MKHLYLITALIVSTALFSQNIADSYYIDLQINDNDSTRLVFEAQLDNDGYVDHYTVSYDPDIVSLYGHYYEEKNEYHINIVDENESIDDELNFIESSTAYINKINSDSTFIDAFNEGFIAFRYQSGADKYNYGWIRIYAPHFTVCHQYVENIGCIDNRHLPILEFLQYSLESTPNLEIITGQGTEQDVTLVLSNTKRSITNQSLNFYPNPAQDFLIIDSPNEGKFRILSSQGLSVMENLSGQSKIDISGLNRGIYFLEAEEKSKRVSFVKY